jgi:hypothetical protein
MLEHKELVKSQYYLVGGFMKSLVLFLFLTVLLMGCTHVTMYREPFPSKLESANIDIYKTQKPTNEYIEIGEISANNINSAIAKAREIGADAIIITGYKNIIYDDGVERQHGIRGVAIKYK